MTRPDPFLPSRPRVRPYATGIVLALGAGQVLLHRRLALLDPQEGPVREFLLVLGALFAAYVVASELVRRWSGQGAGVALWAFLVAAASLAVHLPSETLLSNEVHRFRWEGRLTAAGLNPYHLAPSDAEVADLRTEFEVPVPAPERKGLYPPLAELLFYAMARTGFDSVRHYRTVFSLALLAAGLALLPLLRGTGAPPGRVLVFLWHPLLILETGGSAHLESLALLFLLLSLGLLIHAHHLTPLASLGLSILTKAFPVVVLPLYLRRVPWYRWIILALVLGAGALPFLGAGRQLGAGFLEYLGEARFNPGGYLAVEAVLRGLGRPEWTRVVAGGLVLGIALILYGTDSGSNRSILRRALYLSLPPLLLGPVVQPWYVIWILPFLALLATGNLLRWPLLYLSASVLLVHVVPPGAAIPGWMPWVEFAPPIAAILGILGARRGPRRRILRPPSGFVRL